MRLPEPLLGELPPLPFDPLPLATVAITAAAAAETEVLGPFDGAFEACELGNPFGIS